MAMTDAVREALEGIPCWISHMLVRLAIRLLPHERLREQLSDFERRWTAAVEQAEKEAG